MSKQYFYPNFHAHLNKNSIKESGYIYLESLGFKRSDLERRVNQVVFHNGLGKYTSQAFNYWSGSSDSLPFKLRGDRYDIDLKKRHFSLRARGYVECCSIFIRNWIRTFFHLLIYLFRGDVSDSSIPCSIAIVLDPLFKGVGRAQDLDCIRSVLNRITNHEHRKYLIICSQKMVKVSEGYITSPQPIHAALHRIPGGVLWRLKIILQHFRTLSICTKSFLQNHKSLCLFPDLADYALISALESVSTEIITTNSNCWHQSILYTRPRRKFKFSMLWYSTNNLPMYPKSMPGSDFEEFVSFNFMTYDKGYYWTSEHASWATGLIGSHEIAILGPIVLQSVNSFEYDLSDVDFSVAIFDVTPKTDAHHKSSGFLDAYHTSSAMIAFLEDIIDVLDRMNEHGIRVRAFVKAKRSFEPSQCTTYLRLLERLASQYDFLKIVEPAVNPISLVQRVDSVVSVPYTSPAIIGFLEGKPSIYYDPTATLLPHYLHQREIGFVNSKESLGRTLQRHMKNCGARGFIGGSAEGEGGGAGARSSICEEVQHAANPRGCQYRPPFHD